MTTKQENLYQRNATGFSSYPSSGALAHLPVRTTITGDAMIPHPNASQMFLRNLPAHFYTLPNVKLNFTLVEIIVLLPNWFKNRTIASRFMNNDLTASVHFAIFEEHRECNFASDYEREKARRTITDEYRKTMRSIHLNNGWTKAKHAPPPGWDHMLIGMDGFVPDDSRFDEYLQAPPIPFRNLTIGVKKLPEGVHAGDLTRAVKFALQHHEDFVFPDDLPRILDYISHTDITIAHTDRAIARAYVERIRKGADARRPKRVPVEGIAGKKVQKPAQQMESEWNATMNVQQYQQQVRQIAMATPNEHADFQLQPAAVDRYGEEMDALLQPYLTHNNFRTPALPLGPSELYHPHLLLRECIEGNVGFDGSPFARAAQFSQQPDQIGTDWHVRDVPWLVQLFDATATIAGGF